MSSEKVDHRAVKLDPLPWWITETLFWSGFAIVSFLLALYYSQPNLRHVAEIGAEILIAIAFTRPLIWMSHHLQRLSLTWQIVTLSVSVILLSQGWNLMRMLLYPTFFPDAYEGGLWDEFGGWASTAFFIFAVWTAVFYSVRAYTIAASQRELATRERLRRLNAERLTTNAQLKMLRYQINPHFIFNTLNSVNALIATKRNSDARAMIDSLSDLLRMTLDHDPPLIIPLGEELDSARRYLKVEQMRFGDRLNFDIEADQQSLDTPIPSLILQPLVENAIRHGVEAQVEPCQIKIEARLNSDRLDISIRDTGPGIQMKQQPDKREGIGLANVRARLESVYGEAARFSLFNGQTGGVEVAISTPLTVPETFR